MIDYQSAIISALWGCFVFLITNFLFRDFKIKIFLLIVFVLPVLILSVVGINNENIINVFIYMSKFIIKQKTIFYSKKLY